MIELKILVLPSGRQLSYTLEPGQSVSLGREQGDLRFPDDGQMSSFHLTLVGEQAQVHFQDEGSTNGTFLNGRRANSGVAGPEDELSLGQTRIEIDARNRIKPKPAVVRESSSSRESTSPLDTILEVQGSHSTLRKVMPGEKISVGRTDRSDWIFPEDDLMSGLHFVISGQGEQWEIVDARSSNGTFLNAQPVERAILSPGDVITAGVTKFNINFLPLETVSPLSPKSEFFRQTNSNAESGPVDTQPLTSTGDTHRSHWQEPSDQLDHMWLVALPPAQATICIKQGSSLWLTHRTQEAHPPGIVLDWTDRHCRVWTADSSVELTVNDLPTSQAELSNGDTLSYDGFAYQILYTNDPRISPWPSPDHEPVGELEPPPVAAKPAAVASQLQSQEPTASEPTTSEPIAPIDGPPSASRPESVVATAKRSGHLPDDLIGMLVDLVGKAQSMWLVMVDSQFPTQPSVPVPIQVGDASWMLQVEAGWPKHLFLVLFAQSTAEELLVTLLEQAPTGFEFTRQTIDDWLSQSPSVLPLGAISGILVLDGTAQGWVAYGQTPPNWLPGSAW